MDNFAPKVIDDCYHIYSDGTRLSVLCDTEEDYVFIMNQIAITSLYCNVRILCQEVMRTHFHLIARGAPDKIQKYKREIKRLITRRYNRDGLGDIVKDAIQIAVDPIKDDEELRRKIIYVFRNCTEAGFRLLPGRVSLGAWTGLLSAGQNNVSEGLGTGLQRTMPIIQNQSQITAELGI